MNDLQSNYLKDLTQPTNKISVFNSYLQKIETFLNDNGKPLKEIFNFNSINLTTSNIFIEYCCKKLIEGNKLKNLSENDIFKIYVFVLLYHPKLIELIMEGKTHDEYEEARKKMLTELENIYNERNKDEKYETIKKILSFELKKDNLNILEYCYFLSWANFKRETTDIDKKTTIEINGTANDILCLNVSYNLKYLQSIIKYNSVPDIVSPVLTEEMIKQTKKYEFIEIKNKATEPISIYDGNFNRKQELTTNTVNVYLDYGNSYYTQLYYNNLPVICQIAKKIQKREIISDTNKQYLYDYIHMELFKYLPDECYTPKLEREIFLKTLDILKKIVIASYVENNPQQTIKNIMNNSELSQVLKKEELKIFEIYLKYLDKLEDFNISIVQTYICNYIFEDALYESPLITD